MKSLFNLIDSYVCDKIGGFLTGNELYNWAKATNFKIITADDILQPAMTDNKLWKIISTRNSHLEKMEQKIMFLMNEFGTSMPCNRFAVGNSVEFILAEFLECHNLSVDRLPNAKRIDLCINDHHRLSIKYSSSGNIKLHNSNNSINHDEQMTDLVLLTTKELYLITRQALKEHNIVATEYIKNTGDGLALQRRFLTFLKKNNYPYVMSLCMKIDKTNCKNRSCCRVFYREFEREFNESINIS